MIDTRAPREQSPPRTFYSAAEVAASVHLTKKQVYAMCRDGLIRSQRFGKHLRIPADELARLQADAA